MRNAIFITSLVLSPSCVNFGASVNCPSFEVLDTNGLESSDEDLSGIEFAANNVVVVFNLDVSGVAFVLPEDSGNNPQTFCFSPSKYDNWFYAGDDSLGYPKIPTSEFTFWSFNTDELAQSSHSFTLIDGEWEEL